MLQELFPGKAPDVAEDFVEDDNVAEAPFPGKSSGRQGGDIALVSTALGAEPLFTW
jgi:hypothetical protein